MKHIPTVGTEIKYRRPQGQRWSIQKCFVLLGAPPVAVYRGSKYTGRKTPISSEEFKPRSTRWSLYDEYSGSELRKWLDDLFRGSMVKYHPDNQAPRMVKFYTRKCQEISEAYERAKKILSWH